MESYKEKYEQALEIAKKTCNTQPMYREWLEQMFPELAESEDEKVRRVLVDFFRDWRENRSHCWGIAVSKILAWLEKQGEPSDEEMKTLLRTEYEKGRADAIAGMQMEWSEEDELQMQAIIDLLPGLTIRHNWLKSLKDRVKPQYEWSEEDERNLQGIIDEIEANKNQAPDYDLATYDRFLSWLKSLRPQNKWKPSEEQMKALNYVVNLMASSESSKENDYYYNVFKDLRKQLKKLKEG